MASQGTPLFRTELWHAGLLVLLFTVLVPLEIVDPWALLLGGLFMGLNFLFLGFGMLWLLRPFAEIGRVRTGLFLLILKLVLFLGLVSALFLRLRLDAPSFAVGVSSLLAAIIMERAWASWRSQ